MSYSRPLVSSSVPFDANVVYNYPFTYVPGDQYTHIGFTVQTNVLTPVTVYTFSGASFNSYCIIPAHTLTNGIEYKITVRVGNGTLWSAYSYAAVFTCYSPVVLTIPSLSGGIANNQSYELTGTYTQAQGDTLKSYRYYLYDENGVILTSSDEVFVGIESYTLSYITSGLINDVTYGAELRCTTQGGMEATSGVIPFTAHYVQPVMYAEFEIENQPLTGTVKLSAFIRQITATVTGTYNYVGGEWIDLTADGTKLIYDERMDLFNQNYQLQIWMKGITADLPFLTLNGSRGVVTIYYSYNRFWAMKETSDGVKSLYESSTDITIGSNTVFSLIVRTVNDAIDLVAIEVT